MILVDSCYIVSLFVHNEKNHKKAEAIWKDIRNEKKVITNLILSEVLNLLSKKLNNNTEQVLEIYGAIVDNYELIYEKKSLHDKSMKTFVKYNTYLSLADCFNVETMEELGIYEIVSFDEHFDKLNKIVRIHDKKVS